MSDTVWVGLIDVQPGIDGTGGAYAYCAGRGATVTDAVAVVGAEAADRGFEMAAGGAASQATEARSPVRRSDVAALGHRKLLTWAPAS
jgi:hypothetical protein